MKIRDLFNKNNLLEKEPWKGIFLFAIPLIIGNFAQQSYNAADAMVVGNYIGDNALSSIGASTSILFFLRILFVGIASGVSIMVSQYFGAKTREDLSYTIGNCITLTAIASVILMLSASFLPILLLRAINVPEHLIPDAKLYLQILMIASPFIAYYNILAGILRGLGDSLSALIYVIITSVINVILDIIFVKYFNLGIAGVGYATGIAQGISAVLCYLKINKMKDVFRIKRKHYKFSAKYAKQISKLGIPSGFLQAILSFSNILVQALSNRFGDVFIAANLITMRVDGFAILTNISLGTAMITFTGQNIGAGRWDRVEKGKKHGIIIALITSLCLTVLVIVFGKILMRLFTKNEEIIDTAMSLLYIIASGFVIFGTFQVLFGIMRGGGDTVTPMWIVLFTTLLFRMPVSYLIAYLTKSPLHPNGHPTSTYWSLVISWVLTIFITFYFFKKGKWREKSIINRYYDNDDEKK